MWKRLAFNLALSNHYIQMERNYGKMHIGRVFLCVQMGTHFNFLQLLLCCAEFLLEKYPVWQLIMPSCLVVKQNFPNTTIIVNYYILIIRNWSGYVYVNFHSNLQILQDSWHFIWNELPYIILDLRKIWVFLWYFDKNSIVRPKCTAKKSIWI